MCNVVKRITYEERMKVMVIIVKDNIVIEEEEVYLLFN